MMKKHHFVHNGIPGYVMDLGFDTLCITYGNATFHTDHAFGRGSSFAPEFIATVRRALTNS